VLFGSSAGIRAGHQALEDTSQLPMPEEYQALTHARAVVPKHELTPAVWQRVFHDTGFGPLEAPVPGEPIKQA
jgi:hypothetical protein